MLKIWDLAKKSHFASVLATDAAYANFLHTMMNYIENGIYHQFLKKNVDKILTRQRQLLLKDRKTLWIGNKKQKVKNSEGD